MQGFQKALMEYESKITNPYDQNNYSIYEDDTFSESEIEERILENQVEDYLWYK